MNTGAEGVPSVGRKQIWRRLYQRREFELDLKDRLDFTRQKMECEEHSGMKEWREVKGIKEQVSRSVNSLYIRTVQVITRGTS